MAHHGHHHHGHHQEQQNYGGYPGNNSGSYDAGYAPQAPPYGYQQPPQAGYGGYGYGEQPSPYGGYGSAQPYGGYGSAQPSTYGAMQSYPQNSGMGSMNNLLAHEKKHQNHEHMGEAVAMGAGALAAYERHEMKVDPLHAAKHRREEEAAGVVAVGAAGYALHEHQQSRHDHQQLQADGYDPEQGHGHKHEKKHHHGLFK